MGTSATPHLGRLDDPQYLFSAPSQREAIARLHFALEHQLNLAVLTGESGSGKSLLLSQFERELRASPHGVFPINLHGMNPEELTHRFASWLGVESNCPPQRLWINITQRLIEMSYDRSPLVVLGDDAQAASPRVLDWLARLWGILPAECWQITIILAMRTDTLTKLPTLWRERLDLRIELEPWSLDDIREFHQAVAADEAHSWPTFTLDALERLHQLSGGLPRKVRRFTSIAMLAAISQHQRQIDEETLLAVAAELCGVE